jgi:hypothetical protein
MGVQETLDPKTVATYQARAAIQGYQLVALADGTFMVSRWQLFKTLEHPAAVESFLERVEGEAARA